MLKTLDKPNPKKIRIGPADDGRRMSLANFDEAVAQEGYLYELNKGVIEVSGIPQPDHGMQVQELRDRLGQYRLNHPGVVSFIGGGSEAKLLIGPAESERHPDLSVYLDPLPAGKKVWSRWVPAIVIEVVSDRSSKRDYEDKPSEYFAFGVKEYWIFDAKLQQMTAMSRIRGFWESRKYKSTQKFTTPLLPGFVLDLKCVLSAGK